MFTPFRISYSCHVSLSYIPTLKGRSIKHGTWNRSEENSSLKGHLRSLLEEKDSPSPKLEYVTLR